jgi:hypothetical protein
VLERFDSREKKVGSAPHGGEGWQSGDFLADWTLGDFKFERTVLMADDRIAFITELVEVRPIRPNVLQELELTDKARAEHKRCDAALDSIFWCVIRQMWPIGGAPRRIIRRRLGFAVVSRGFMRRQCDPSGMA